MCPPCFQPVTRTADSSTTTTVGPDKQEVAQRDRRRRAASGTKDSSCSDRLPKLCSANLEGLTFLDSARLAAVRSECMGEEPPSPCKDRWVFFCVCCVGELEGDAGVMLRTRRGDGVTHHRSFTANQMLFEPCVLAPAYDLCLSPRKKSGINTHDEIK